MFVPEPAHLGPERCLHCLFLFPRQKAMTHSIQQDLIDLIQVKIEGIGQQLYLVVERGIEQGWIVRVDGHRHPGSVEARQGMLSIVCKTSYSHVTRWAYLQRDALLGEISHERCILNRPHAMPYALGAQCPQSSPYAGRPGGFSRVRYTVQSCSPRLLKPPGELFRWVVYFSSTHPYRHHPIILPLYPHGRLFLTTA